MAAMRKRNGFRVNHSESKDTIEPQPKKADDPFNLSKKHALYLGLLFLLALLVGLNVNWRDLETDTHRLPRLAWWQTTIVYQIYPRSFQDSDGDGVGDIQGIIQRLDYIRSLNVRAIWLNPFFRSPMRDFGYDISNYTDVDPIFGSLDDFDILLSKAHSKGIKVILDFVPNHTSDLHPWFQLSRRGVAPYKDYYVWTRAGDPPNNWLSLFRGPAWSEDPVRGELYYHAFLPQQPDLNWRCPQLVQEMKNVLRFWLDRGVDGFRVDAIQNMYETQDLSQNEPPSEAQDIDKDDWYSLRHDHTFNSPEIGGAVRGWREVLDEYEARDGHQRYLVVETLYDNDVGIRNQYYNYGADMPFNFDLLRINRSCGGHCIQQYVHRELGHLLPGNWPNFVVGNHDNPRIATKMGDNFVNAVNMMLLTLPGTPTTYYGEELGMADVHVPFELGQDLQAKRQGKGYFRKYSRDPSRTPMQWDESKNAGFTSGPLTWLPVSDKAHQENVKLQLTSGPSPLQLYRKLAFLRDEPCFQHGTLKYAVINENIFSYIRSTKAAKGYLIAINFGTKLSIDDYSKASNAKREGKIIVTTENFQTGGYRNGDSIFLNKIDLSPGQGLVIKLSR